MKEKEVTRVVIDPNNDTADTNFSNNSFPKKPNQSKFDLLKETNGVIGILNSKSFFLICYQIHEQWINFSTCC